MNKSTSIIGFLLSFFAGGVLMWGIDRGSPHGAGTNATKEGASVEGGVKAANAGAVKVELYVMSKCPYGVQAENGFKDVVEKFGSDIDFKVEYIGNTAPTGDFSSLHGPTEVKGDLYQVCAQKYSPKWFDMILCQNKAAAEVATNWEECAKEAGVPADKISACADGQEGKDLLAASFKKAQEKGVRGSPTIYIADKEYQGGRKASDFMKAICNGYSGNRPAICSDIPESPKVNVTYLSDKRCTECDANRMKQMIGQKVANPVPKMLDYSDPEGRKLYDSIKPAKLPVAIFDSTIDGDKDAMAGFGASLRPAGDFKVLGAGSWNPACADDGGCNLDECKKEMACKPEEAGRLDVFVMSHCPFGVKGLNAMQEVVENFKKADSKFDGSKLNFQIHYIGDGDAKSGFKSMHGPDEVAEDLREVCAIDHYGKDFKYMDYIWCRDKNIKSNDWQSCATKETGIDADVIKKCSEGDEGKDLLEKSFKYSSDAGIGASPTWLANGKFKFSGIDSETVKTNFCNHNKFPGCDAKLTGQAPSPSGGAAPAPAGCGG